VDDALGKTGNGWPFTQGHQRQCDAQTGVQGRDELGTHQGIHAHVIDRTANIQLVRRQPEDLAQLLAGACVLALPAALTEEVWDLGKTLSVARTLAIFALSLLTLAGFIWGLFYGGRIREYPGHFLKRVFSAYLMTFMVSLLLLFMFDKAPLDQMGVTLTRAVIVAFPSSFAATAVDFIN